MIDGTVDDVLEWLRDQIDGGDECHGRDQAISAHIRTLESARDLLHGFGALKRLYDGQTRHKLAYHNDDLATCHVGCIRRAALLTDRFRYRTPPSPQSSTSPAPMMGESAEGFSK